MTEAPEDTPAAELSGALDALEEARRRRAPLAEERALFNGVLSAAEAARGDRRAADARLMLGGQWSVSIDPEQWLREFMDRQTGARHSPEKRRASLKQLLVWGPTLSVDVEFEIVGVQLDSAPVEFGAGVIESTGRSATARYRETVDLPVLPPGAGATESPVDDLVTGVLLALTLALRIPVSRGRCTAEPALLARASRQSSQAVVSDGAPDLSASAALYEAQVWAKRIAAVPSSRLRVPASCLATMLRRPSEADSIIEAVVGFEALTGLTSVRRREPVIVAALNGSREERRASASLHRELTEARDRLVRDGLETAGTQRLARQAVGMLHSLIVVAIVSGGSLDPSVQESAPATEEVRVAAASVPSAVVNARLRYAAGAARSVEQLKAPLGSLFIQSRAILADLSTRHAAILDSTDLDPRLPSRPSAVWLMSGRCLALAIAATVATRAGVGNASTAMVRSMHEANRLLDAFLDEDEGMILSRWLNDEQVRPEDARKTTNDTSLRDLERIKAAGVEITPIDIRGVSQEIYRVLSSGAHNQRSSVDLDYSPALRRYSYTLDDVREVAGHAVGVAAVVEEAVIAVSKALWHFVPGFEFSRDVKPQIDTLHRLRADVERHLR